MRRRQVANVYCAPQYGHLAVPFASTGKYTLGWEFHNVISGIGHDNGKSARVIVYRFSALAGIELSGTG